MRAPEFIVENQEQAAVDALLKKHGWSVGKTINGDPAFTWQGSTYVFYGERVRITSPNGKSVSVVWGKKPDWQGRPGDISFAQALRNKYITFDLPIWQALDRGQINDAQALQQFKTENERQAREAVAQGANKGAPAPSFFDRVRGHNLNEVNIDTDYNPDELTVKQKFIDYFVNKGYKMLGEGRDQIAFLSPRNTVVKVLGLGDTAKQQAVEHYVEFFERNQRNPFYPKIYNSQRFDFEGDSYFLYETEYLQFVSNEDDTLDWLERYLNHLGTDPAAAQEWVETNGVPDDIGEDQLYGLTQSTEDIIKYLAVPKGYMMDLSNIENIRRRSDGHLVIVDPVSI